MSNEIQIVPTLARLRENLTMTSLEIAELTGKRHRDVLRDIRKMFEDLEISGAQFCAVYTNQQLMEQPMFKLPEREVYILMSGYNIKLRTAIIDRWMQLEAERTVVTNMFVEVRGSQRLENESFKRALSEYYNPATDQNFSEAYNRINYLVLGCGASAYKEKMGLKPDAVTRDFLTPCQNKAILGLQRAYETFLDLGDDLCTLDPKLRHLFNKKYKAELEEEAFFDKL
jgi:phage regulator Rha-like protein